MIRSAVTAILIFLILTGCAKRESPGDAAVERIDLEIKYDEAAETISVFIAGSDTPVLVQNAKNGFRPYIHPIVAPDGNGVLTEYSPGHHPHQTGLYWGFTRVNGRDYFHNTGSDYWRKISAGIREAQGPASRFHQHESHNHDHDHGHHHHHGDIPGADNGVVQWQTVYDLLDENGHPILTETQNWTMQVADGKFTLDLEWRGEAKTDITIGKFDYGGLFLRMPWQEGIQAEVVNAVRDRNERAEGQRAMWLNVAMQVPGRENFANIAIFDHSGNNGYPTPWRVDGQFGVGPSRTIMEEWFIEEGDTEVIRYRMLVHTGEMNDVEITSAWEDYVDNRGTYSTAAMWGIAREAGFEAEFLTPREAAANMTLIDGFKVTAWAGEPDITTPMAFAWDDRGRLWVAENNDYESRGTGFSAAGNSRILILEDTNGDGYADSRKVFLEGIAFPAAMAIGFGGLYLGAPPNLLFVPNRDDKADIENIEVLLTGWGIDDRHETINSLHWGPDGWLYGLQGLFTHSNVGKPKPGAKRLYTHNDPFPESLGDLLDGEGVRINGGIWRYHPVKDRFEVVAHGLSNPWGIDHDAKGQLFVTACVIPHLWHIVPGGVYHRQGGSHFNPYIYNDIKTIADHRHRSAHGGASVYLSDAFPETHFGRIFMANIHEHAVLSDILERDGSSFRASHGDDFLLANNAAWVGFSTEIGPDGGLYILDWHDRDICGTAVLNQDTGRVFKVMPEESRAEQWEGRYDDVSGMTDEQLVILQTKNSAWHARRARVNLQYRASKGALAADTHEKLRNMFRSEQNPDWRLRAMWALHITGGLSENDLVAALNHSDEYIRAWAVQMLSEDYAITSPINTGATIFSNWALNRPSEVRAPSSHILAAFERMSRTDNSPVVRLYLASLLHRLNLEHRWGIAEGLMQRGEDAGDHNIPGMLWFGFEPLVADNPGRALAIAGKSWIPVIARYASRRAADSDAFEELVAEIGTRPEQQIPLLEGLRDGLEGRRSDLVVPPNWEQVYGQLRNVPGRVSELALDVAQQFGDREASMQFLATLINDNAPIDQRREALRALAEEQSDDLKNKIPALLASRLRVEAIRAIASFNDANLGRLLLEKYPDFDNREKSETVRALASRPVYGRLLTQALKDGKIPKRDIPVDVARQLQRVVGVGFVDVWGPIGDEQTANEMAYARFRAMLTEPALAQADARRGRLVFQSTCGPCHVMYDEGGTIGPDLTGSNRQNIDYILRMVIDPNEMVADAYKLVVISTRDGRTYSGNIVSESERQITLRTVGLDEVVINKSDIQTREDTGVSLMPPRLFDTLTDDEVKDLIKYLQTDTQVSLPPN
ncbi:MAG: dehydrogenase [Balneolaceae bacterium]|nr:MAG: dehydrogenase [Balneolaceae bacterium]